MLPVNKQELYNDTLKLTQQNNFEKICTNLEILGADVEDPRLLELFQKMQVLQTEIEGHVKRLVKGSPFVGLPPDCLARIFCNLSLYNIFRCFVVCKGLNEKMKTDGFSGLIYHHYFPKHPIPEFLNCYDACRRAANKNRLVDAPPHHIVQLRSTFLTVHNGHFFDAYGGDIESLVLKTRERVKRSSMGEVSDVCSILHGEEFYLAGVFFNGKTRLMAWDLKKLQCLHEFKYTSENIRICCLGASGRILYAGLANGLTVAWDVNSREQLHSFKKNDHRVTCLLPLKNKLYSGLEDGTIEIWDLNGPNQPTYEGIFSCPGTEIKSLIAFHKTLCCTTSDRENGELRFYDLDAKNCFRIYDKMKFTCPPIIVGEKLYSGFSRGLTEAGVMVFDKTGQCLQTVKTPDPLLIINNLAVYDGELFSLSTPSHRTLELLSSWNLTSEYLSLVELAQLFREKNEDKKEEAIAKAMEQFSNLPQDVKNEIYGKLYLILRPFQNDYLGCAEHAFHGQYGLSSTPEQKARAIENYAARDL